METDSSGLTSSLGYNCYSDSTNPIVGENYPKSTTTTTNQSHHHSQYNPKNGINFNYYHSKFSSIVPTMWQSIKFYFPFYSFPSSSSSSVLNVFKSSKNHFGLNSLLSLCSVLFFLLIVSNNFSPSFSAPSSSSSSSSSSPSIFSSATSLTSLQAKLPVRCSSTQFSCGDSCIPGNWRCDRSPDCKDQSDEKDCPLAIECDKNEFKCDNGKCVTKNWLCDGEDDCGDRSDERNCSIICPSDHFTCLTGNQCIKMELKCNQITDCPDGSDENDCKSTECSKSEFKCNDGICIDKAFVCDQEYDCKDQSDEINCNDTTCASNQFTCGDGKCIPDMWKCDGTMDCKDESDEINCNSTSKKPFNCNDKSFRCHDGLECIHVDWKCDGVNDCKDGSDEKGCIYNNTCRNDQFMCTNGHCIPSYMRCNGAHECLDHSDETNCDTHLPVFCGPDMFQCNSSSKCIPKDKVCDRDNDCGDWSDEPMNYCNINECASLTTTHCSHECIDDPIAYHCACPKGLRLGNDSKTCYDIDECKETFGICSNHKCINTKGGFKCECFDGYQLVDHRFCRVKTNEQPFIIFANRHDIRQAYLPANRSGPRHYTPLYRALSSAVAIDYNLAGNYLIWSDVAVEGIFIGKLNKDKESKYAKENATALISTSIKSVYGVAIDWVHDLLYWTDDIANTIEVAQIANPLNRKIIIESGLDEPRAIVIDVKENMIVWADWGDQAFIERASQDGSNRKKLVETSILWPNALTLDTTTKKIYWLDVKYHTLSAINYDGSGRITLYESPSVINQPFSVDIFEDYLYYSDWKLESIQRMNINDEPHKADTFMHGLVENPMGVKIVHASKQLATPNRCESAKCSHLCLPSTSQSTNYSCICRKGYLLAKDGYSCVPTTSKISINKSTTTINKSTSQQHQQQSKVTTSTPTPRISTITPPLTKGETSSSSSPSSSPSSSSSSSTSNESDKLDVEDYASSSSSSSSSSTTSHKGDKSKDNLSGISNDSLNLNDNTNVVLNSTGDYYQNDAHLAFFIIAICLTIALFITLLTFIIHRNYAKRSITSMNFDNPVYRKTTEEQFVLEKSEDNVNSYPSSLEPLNSPGTNEFV